MRIHDLIGLGAVSALAVMSAPAMAATSFFTNFDSYTVDAGAFGSTGGRGWDVVPSVEGWTATAGAGIEIQRSVAGAPFSSPNHIELDSHRNSSMSRAIEAGTYSLSFFYSPRPHVSARSNPIDVLLNGSSIFSVTATGGGATSWSQMFVSFTANKGDILSFAATGKNDSLGGYIDDISLSGAVPEPTSWAMMIAGFGAVGAAMRRRRTATFAAA
jgi:hypothetical protein